jgi:Uncharacterised nucleotidyltransferase
MSEAVADILFLCRCLSVDDSAAAVSALRSEICTGEIDWRQIADLAADHFLTPVLWVSLSRKRLAPHLPEDAREFLRYVHGLNVERTKALRAEVLQIASSLNEVGVEPILLKGAINLSDSAYGDFGARMMSDIDILVSEAEIPQVLRALADFGYLPPDEEKRHAHAYSDLHKPGKTCGIDLHWHFGFQKEIVTYVDVRREAVLLETNPLKLLAPSPKHRVFHNMFHAQIQNSNQLLGIVPLMQLCDFAALGRYHAGTVDWAWLCAVARRHNMIRALRAYVHLAVELFGLPRPPEFPESFRDRLHSQRCLAQLRHPALMSFAQQWGSLTHVLKPLRVSSNYGCSTNRIVINVFRLRLIYDQYR